MRVLVFGDSITQGFIDADGGWVNRLRRQYDEVIVATGKQDQPTVFNLGISGDTTKNILDRIDNEIRARQWPGEELVIVVATGTNDTVYRGDEHDSEPEAYADQLSKIFEVAKKYSTKIAFVSLFPVVDNLLQPFPWSSSGKCYSTERMKLFNDTLVSFCSDNSVPLFDLWSGFEQSEDLGSLFFDGIHPNGAGHSLIAESVKPKLQELIA